MGRKRRYHDDYDDYDTPRRHRRRHGPFARFFVGVFWTLGTIIGFCIVLMIAFNFAAFIELLVYGFYVGVVLAFFGLIYLIVRLFAAMSRAWSRAKLEKAEAEQEYQEALHREEQIRQLRSKRLREEETFYRRQEVHVIEADPPMYQSPRKTRHLPPPEEEIQPRVLAQQAKSSTWRDRSPEDAPRRVFAYADYAHYVQPGQLIIGIREDGTPRIGTWQDFKIVLVLGSSSSGKTTTIVEKVLGAACGGGQLVVCDPHGYKPDSLLRRIAPLSSCLMPGTTLAINHDDIMRNVDIVKEEHDRRVAGGSCTIPIYLVIEEFNRLQRDKEIAAKLKLILQELGQEARGFNIFVILGAQIITHLAEIRKSIISFIIHRVDESEASRCIPARYAKFACELGTGITYVKDADGVTECLQQVLVTVEDVEQRAFLLSQREQRRVSPRQIQEKPGQEARSQRYATRSLADVPLNPSQTEPRRRTQHLPNMSLSARRPLEPQEDPLTPEQVERRIPRRASRVERDPFEVLAERRHKKRQKS
jgi:hypothetical protein